LLALSSLWLPCLLGAVGLLAALIRPRDGARQEVLLIAALLAPFALFLFSRQQSPQYYLLGQVLLFSSVAGLVGSLPRVWLRLPVALALLALAAPWAWAQLRSGLDPHEPGPLRLHSESWPVAAAEAEEVMDWALERAGQEPLLVVSGAVENIDALSFIRQRRPVGFLFREWTDRIPEAVAVYQGRPVYLLSVERVEWQQERVQGAELVDLTMTSGLAAWLYRLPGRAYPLGVEDPCARGGQVRGACLQRVWLEGGQAALKARMLEVGRGNSGLQGWGAMWW